MKRLPLLLILLAYGLALTETWTNHKGLVFTARSWQIVKSSPELTRIKSRGGVSFSSAPDGITITSEQLDFDAATDPKNSKAYRLSHATATTNVHIVKTVTSPSGKQITDVLGPKAEYTAGLKESTVRMIGPTIIKNMDQGQLQSIVATGSSGIAYLESGVKVSNGNGLRRAVLEGPVKVVFHQAATKTEAASDITATASQMQLENVGDQRRITLIGSVHVLGPGSDEATGINRALIVHDPGGSWRLDATGD